MSSTTLQISSKLESFLQGTKNSTLTVSLSQVMITKHSLHLTLPQEKPLLMYMKQVQPTLMRQ